MAPQESAVISANSYLLSDLSVELLKWKAIVRNYVFEVATPTDYNPKSAHVNCLTSDEIVIKFYSDYSSSSSMAS